jgi:hypothetical protein
LVLQNAWLSGDRTFSSSLAISAWIALGLIVVAYLIARFLKKREIIRG